MHRRQSLDDLLRRSRPEPPEPLVHALATRVASDRRRRPMLRAAARTAILTAAMLIALSTVGGLGYAMSVATNIVVKATSHKTYVKRAQLPVKISAAVAQYGTTTSETTTTTPSGGGGGGGGGIGPPPGLVSAAPGDGTTVQSVSSILLIASLYCDWTNVRVTRPDGSVTTLDDRQGTSQRWIFEASASGLYSITGSLNANNGSGITPFSSHFTIFVPPTTTGGSTPPPPPPPVQATVTPARAGDLTSADGKATVVWPAQGFATTPVVVQVTPVPESVIQNLPPNSLVMQVTATAVGTNAGVTALNGVIDVQFPNAPAGAAPLVSSDGATWHAVPQLSSLTLPAGQADGYFRDGATIHLLTRHLTYFALAAGGAATKLAVKLVSPPRIWTIGRTHVSVYLNVTAAATVTTRWLDGKGAVVPGTTSRSRVVNAGATLVRLLLPTVLQPGTYKLQVVASALGQTATTTKLIRVFGRQPVVPAPTASHPAGIVIVDGTSRAANQLSARLGSRYRVSTASASALFDAVDPRTSKVAALVVDLDHVPVSVIASIRSVFPELQIAALTSDAVSAKAGRRAGATIVVAKPVATDTLASVLRLLAARGR